MIDKRTKGDGFGDFSLLLQDLKDVDDLLQKMILKWMGTEGERGGTYLV